MAHDHGITILNVAQNMLYGAALGAGASVFSYIFTKADKKIVLDRALFQHRYFYFYEVFTLRSTHPMLSMEHWQDSHGT